MNEAAPWTADRKLDADLARRAIYEAVPELAGVRVEALGSGWDFDAYEADGRYAFRFPRRADVQPSVQKDLLVLPWVAARVEIPVPRYGWGVLRAASFPYVFSGYETLPGLAAATRQPHAALVTRLGRLLGAFLSTLHALSPPREIVSGAGLDRPLVDPGPLRARMRKYLTGFCARVPELAESATRFFDTSAVPPPYAGPPRLIHADLHAEHLLLDPAHPERITGVIDWSDVHVGDPARDFACIYSWGGEPMLRAMLESYGPADSGLEVRSRFLGTCFSFMDWTWWVEIGNEVAARAAHETLAKALPRAG